VRVDALLHLYPPAHCGGADMMLHAMFRALAERGHQVHVWLTHRGDQSTQYALDGIVVHPTGTAEPDWPRADVIVSQLRNVSAAATIAESNSQPFVNVVHSTRRLFRMQLDQPAALLVYNSEWVAAELGHRDNSIVVRPPVRAADYKTRSGGKVCLVNLNPAKGGHLFWQLAETMPDVRFLGVLGSYGDQIVRALPNVELREHGTDMRAVYRSSRLVLMPSAYESWGRVGVEAMASGIPVLAHPTRGLRESLGEAGIYLDRDDPAAWVTAIRGLLEQPETWRAASRKARARSAQLDPTEDLARWCAAIEALATS
jgi:glycosyltransferase involved in cell wall biosynthesis